MKKSEKPGLNIDPPWISIDINSLISSKVKGIQVKDILWTGNDIKIVI